LSKGCIFLGQERQGFDGLSPNGVVRMNKETKVRARPAAIILTSAAEARIAELMSRAPEGAIGVKLSTPRRGCSGLAYSV
jgi:hypothetical protein